MASTILVKVVTLVNPSGVIDHVTPLVTVELVAKENVTVPELIQTFVNSGTIATDGNPMS
jgi:hypothetical protein